VAVKIKLKRLGKIREPYYRIVVADSRTKRDGRAIEEIGKYHPKAEPSVIEVNSERVQHWLSVGAQPTDPVRVLLKVTGDWQKFTGEPGAEGTLRTAAPREDRKERFAAAARESQAGKEAADKASGSGRTAGRAARPAKDKEGSAQGGQAQGGQAQGGKARAASAKAGDTAAEAEPAQASTGAGEPGSEA
jgi:small subunit ribosomal protein S16